MRPARTPLVTAILALAAGSAVSQEPLTPVLACHVRGSRQWLATRPSPLDSVVVTVRGATAKIFQNLRQVATGTGEVVRMAEPLEQFTIRSESDSTTPSLLLEWGTWRVRIPLRPVL